ncbi:unnamed protein product [Parascedosporium putredinis]|uniref:Uncharacterized protein n=1 Tax=Parascedosporium putredinis TaxID=1442378 RepID=A0A9P1H795_9PEZI|nr:unnamed protein product [Parascedosporium putredinis]CAI7999626.1 unnamed protein product [Parascedosporium putredinis]
MEKNDRSYRYSQRAEDVTPRRMPSGGAADDVPRSGKRRAATPSQDKPSGRDHGRRESATTGRDEYSY